MRRTQRILSYVIISTALLTAALAAGTAEAATYYTATTGSDSNSGTQSAPFRTVRKGLSVIRAGDTLLIRGGVYSETIDSNGQTIPTGTSWTDAPQIRAYPGETVVVSAINLAASYIQYLIIDGLTINGGGVSVQNGAHHIRIQNGEVKNSPGQGIQGWYVSNIEFINLKVHHNGSSRLDHGIYVAIMNLLIDGCEFYENSGYGIHIYDSSGSRADNAVIRNNRVYNNYGDAGVILSYGTNMQFYNNIVYNNVNGVSANYTANNAQFYNNTIYNHPGGSGIEVGRGASGTVLRNNIIYQNGTPIINYGSSTVSSHNLTTNPMFTDPTRGNFELQSGSPAIDAGTAVSGVTTDFNGVRRPTGVAYDIGAHEFGGIAAPAAPLNVRILQ